MMKLFFKRVSFLLAAIVWATMCFADNSLTSTGTASFNPPFGCRAIGLKQGQVQGCGIKLQRKHSILIHLTEGLEKVGKKDGEGVARSTFRSMLWPNEFADGQWKSLSEDAREKLIDFEKFEPESWQYPESASECTAYRYRAEDKAVPGLEGKLFVREEIGLICAAAVPRAKDMFVHQTWIKVCERYSPDLGQSKSPRISWIIKSVMSSFKLGY